MTYYFDMDGTIADFYVGDWLGDILASNPRPYEQARRLVDEATMMKFASNGKVAIISWLAKGSTKEYDKAVRKAKKQWLASNYPNIKFSEIHIVKYGTPKSRVASNKFGVLFDDEEQNRKEWKGKAYKPEEIEKWK